VIEIEKWWIKNGEGMKELRDRRNFSFSLVLFVVWLGGIKIHLFG